MQKKLQHFSAMLAKTMAVIPAVAASLLLFAGIASAHVTVKPGSTSPGAWETYTIKIPVEKEIPTVKVALKIPEGLDFKQYRAIPDWKVELTKDSSERITVVTWTAENEGILPGEFQQFDFVAKNPDTEAELAWDAFQYYSDGSIVEWTGGEGSEKPHSITQVTSQQAGADSASQPSQDHDHDRAASSSSKHTWAENHATEDASGNGTDAAEATTATSDTGQESSAPGSAESNAASSGASAANTWTVILSSAALLVSLIALSLTIRSTRKSA